MIKVLASAVAGLALGVIASQLVAGCCSGAITSIPPGSYEVTAGVPATDEDYTLVVTETEITERFTRNNVDYLLKYRQIAP